LNTLKMMLVAGARPNFMKIASIINAIDSHNLANGSPRIQRVLVHTGQHYGEHMSNSFFRDLGIPMPDVDLEVGSASHAQQTAEIMRRFEGVLLVERPDVLLVVGDVNSTAACALVASKIDYSPSHLGRTRPLIAHVEAGLRSFDRSMPEEINRIVTDALSDFLFITEENAAENLRKEGAQEAKIHWVGNTMVDTLLRHREKAQASSILSRLGLQQGAGQDEHRAYAVVTLHRPSNVDNRETFREILEALSVLARKTTVLFPAHPRTTNRIKEFYFEDHFDFLSEISPVQTSSSRIQCIPPLGYLDFLRLMSNARLILTDSGGIQEETTVLGVSCVTLRENTERPVTLSNGNNVLAGTKKEKIIRLALERVGTVAQAKWPRYWDGQAGARIVHILAGHARAEGIPADPNWRQPENRVRKENAEEPKNLEDPVQPGS
jgi:UDP-N-acetylglucosamine 2-epimerase (non-hydrolysing)